MKYLGLAIAALFLCGCATSKGTPEYIREQVYQCRVLCANAEVNIARIEGLDCVCSKPQTPIFYNPIVTGSNGTSRSETLRTEIVNRSPSVVSNTVTELEPKGEGFVNSQGRSVFSQSK